MDYNFLKKLESEMIRVADLGESLNLSNITIDGSVNRLDSSKKQFDKAVWLCVHQWEFKGNTYYSAIFGNWRMAVQSTVSSCNDSEIKNNKEMLKVAKKSQEDVAKKFNEEKEKKNQECRDIWTPIYFNARSDLPTHEYLVSKGIKSSYHARIDSYGTLLVPLWDADGVLQGVQRIFRDPVSNKFEKRYSSGIKKIGSFCPFGDLRNSDVIYICEGFATAASVHIATKKAVIAAMDTSNLLDGAKAARKINPHCKLVFAADNDYNHDQKLNKIGERKAIEASRHFSNAIVRVVKFSVANAAWTDFNDLHQFEGIEKVTEQLAVSMSDFIEFIPLGFNDSKYYYFVSHKKQIIELGKSDHTSATLLLNAPAKYWGDRYGYVYKADGTPSKNPDWKLVLEKLGLEIAEKGFFEFNKVRGRGAWEEKGGVVVNLGDRLFYENEYAPLFGNDLGSKFFYEAGKSYHFDFTKELTNEEAQYFIKGFERLNYKTPSDKIIILGQIYSSQVFAALDWRPHVWITGGKGCGKSTILRYIQSMLPFSVMTQDSTASGIRQNLGNDAMSIVYDESEPNTERDRSKMSEIMSLARQSSTRNFYQSFRGSANGKASASNTNANFFMGSIQSASMNAADISRFFLIEMNSVEGQSVEKFKEIDLYMTKAQECSDKLFVRAVNHFKALIKNIETCKTVIKKGKYESRLADQLAPIMAGYFGFFSTDEITESQAESILNELNFKNSDYVTSNATTDSERCFDSIFDLQIPGRSITVGQCIEKIKYANTHLVKEENQDTLALLGLRFDENEGGLFISLSSNQLKSTLEKFQFSDYVRILRRHPNLIMADKSDVFNRRINGNQRKGIIIRIDGTQISLNSESF